MKGSLVDVNISSEGLRASLAGKFSTDIVDPAVVANPGQFLEMPPTPELPLPAGVPQDGAVLVNADSINMMFASLTLSGHLKSECSTSNDPNTGQPRTLGSLLPADCNSISPGNDAAAALVRGLCFGFKTTPDCETLKGPGFFTTPVEQGTCHGMEGDNCDSIATGMSGIVMPDDCNTITIGGGDSTDPSRATDIARGRCFAIKGTNCETLSAGTDVDTAIMQGACHGQKADVCTGIAVSVNPNQEIGTCGAVENIACGTLTFAQTFQCNLSKVENNIIEALLRVAEGLDRSHYQLVRSVRVVRRGKAFTILAQTRPGSNLELWAARGRLKFLGKLIGLPVSLEGESASSASGRRHAGSRARRGKGVLRMVPRTGRAENRSGPVTAPSARAGR